MPAKAEISACQQDGCGDVAILAAAYSKLYAHYCEVHENLPVAVEHARRSLWKGVSELGVAVMLCQPKHLGDVAIQIGLAASWMEAASEGLEQEDNSFAQHIARGIQSVLSNATIFLCSTQEDLPVEGEALVLLNDLYAEVVRCDAQTMKLAS